MRITFLQLLLELLQLLPLRLLRSLPALDLELQPCDTLSNLLELDAIRLGLEDSASQGLSLGLVLGGERWEQCLVQIVCFSAF